MLRNFKPEAPSVRIWSTLFVLAYLASSETSARAVTMYKFTVIAKAGDVIAGQTILVPDGGVMNNTGTIAFSACGSSNYPYNCNVYKTSLSTLAAGPSLVAAGRLPKIDNNGAILFFCGDSEGLCTQSGVLVKSGDTVGGQKITGSGSHAISGNGAILFLGMWQITPINPPFGGSTIAAGLFTPSALLLKTCEKNIASSNPCIAGGVPGSSIGGQMLWGFGLPAINNSGTIVFPCDFDPPASYPAFNGGICTPSTIVARAGSVIGGRTLNRIGAIGLNDAGTIVFDEGESSNDNAIFTPSRVLVKVGDTIGGHMINYIYPYSVSINDGGDIAFLGSTEVQPGLFRNAILTQSDLVVKEGDTVGGNNALIIGGIGRVQIFHGGAVLFTMYSDPYLKTGALVLAQPQNVTPPVIVPTITGTLGNNGWYRSNVTVSWSVTDPESGIASSSGCTTTTLTAETAGVTLTCSATNGAGITSSVPVTIKIDKTPPVISGMPAPGCSLWPPNHKMVQVATVTATDALSGLSPGSFKVTGTSNEASDPKNPDIMITPGVSGGFIIQLRADRSGDGTGRVYSLNATATDLAGNTSTSTATCAVPHDQRK